MFCPDVGIIPLDYGQSGCADYVALQEFDVGEFRLIVIIAVLISNILCFGSLIFVFAVIKPHGVSFVDAAGCIGDSVKAYTALHYLGKLSSGDTGEYTIFK